MSRDPSDYDAAIHRAIDLVVERLPGYYRERRDAEDLLVQLRSLSPEQRRLRLRNSPHRVANRALGDVLLEASRTCLPHDPEESLEWARAAEAVAASYERPHPAHRIRALALQGNAERALGRIGPAERLLDDARQLLRAHPVADPYLHAELLSFLGSLHTALRRLDEALPHLRAAATLYHRLGDDLCRARTYMKLGLLHELAGNLPAAIEADREALRLLSPEADTTLYLSARLNYALHHTDAGEHQRALDLLKWDEDLFAASADAHTRLRVTWLHAQIAAAIGDPAEAETGYLEVRDHFAREGNGFDAAIVCLHLAILYHDQGRLEELEASAVEAVELFRAHSLHDEALSALLLIRRAARTRTLSVEALWHTADTLRRAAHHPARH